jgi:hypothetical protein
MEGPTLPNCISGFRLALSAKNLGISAEMNPRSHSYFLGFPVQSLFFRNLVDRFNLEKGHRLEMIVRDDGIYIPLTEQPEGRASLSNDSSSSQGDAQVTK